MKKAFKNIFSAFMVIVPALTVVMFAPYAHAAPPAPVDLMSLGNFTILTGSGITDANPSSITGNIGAYPITGAAIHVTCAEVTGTIYSSDAAGPLPCRVTNSALLNTAINDMVGTVYGNIAGRAPDATGLGTAGNIGGLTFAPGVYKWSSDVTIPTSITLSGSASDIWIFQISGNLNVSSGPSVVGGVKVLLSGGAQASNVFWQVGGGTGATLGTYSTFNGTILSATQVIMQSGAILNGRALAQTQVTLDANTVTFPTPVTTGPVFIDTNTNGILDPGEQFFSTIQAAITAASSGDTIFVTSGTYDTSGQILINKNLRIVGSDTKPVIRPTANRAAGNAADAWFLISPGVTFSLRNVVLDGSTFFVWQAVRSHGNTTITNVDFRNIQGSLSGSPYRGIAIENFGGTIPGGGGSDSHGAGGLPSTLTVSNSTFAQIGRVGVLTKGTGATTVIQNSVYTGKGAGTFLDYAFEAGAGGTMRASNNSISGNRGVAGDGSTSAGILVTDYYGTGTSAEVNGNSFSSNSVGLNVGYNSTDKSVVSAYGNDFSGETIGVLSTGPSVSAAPNWWGTAVNSEIALKTSGSVVYIPWYTDATLATLSTAVVTPVSSGGSRSATLNVLKVVVNDNGHTKLITDFPLFVNGAGVLSGITNTFPAPSPAYNVTETTDATYAQTFSGDCDLGGRVSLSPGDNKFCIITNDDIGAPVIVPPIPPLIDLVKIPNPSVLPPGEGRVTFTYRLRNIGIVPVTNVTITGDSCRPITLVSGDTNSDTNLDATETWIYTCTTTLAQTQTDTAVATGWANGVSAIDVARTTVLVGVPAFPDTGVVVAPLIHVTKVPNPLALGSGGGVVMYTNVVTNPGSVALANVRLIDNKCAPINYVSGDTNTDGKLDPAEAWVYRCTAHLTKTTTNIVIAEGNANGLSAKDLAIVTVVVTPGFPETGSSATLGLGVRTIAQSLGKGAQGESVAVLQEFLISQNKGSAARALASVGATAYFGTLTRAALAEFQASVSISPPLGYFGPITREYLRAHY